MNHQSQKIRKWWALAALMPSLAMAFLDQSILPVALPTIQKGLGATNIELEWCVNSYLLATAVFVLIGGKLGDRFGHRAMFVFGMLIFVLSSALCGMSPNVGWLIGARAVQGFGSALMFPSSTALLMSLFPPQQRGLATGLNVSASSLFLILGPLVGGYLTEALSWRWIFWINLPLAAAGLLLVFLFIPASSKGAGKIDPWGFLWFLISSSALVVFLMQAADWGWVSFESFGLLLLFLLSGILLFLREKKAAHPFLDLFLFKISIYKAVSLSIFITQFILMVSIYRAVFFQDVLDWSPAKTGLITFFTSMPILFVAPVGGFLSDRFGSKLPIALGYTLLIFSFFWVAFYFQGALGKLILGLSAVGFGVPLILTPSYASTMSAVPSQKAGIAFGMLSTFRALAGTLGVAVIGSLINAFQASSFRHLLDEGSLRPSQYLGLLSGGRTAESLSPDVSHTVLQALYQAKINGFFYTHLWLGFLVTLSFAFVFILYRRKSAHQLPKIPGQGWD